MRDYAGLVNDLRCHAGTCEYKETECSRYNKRFDDTDYTTCSEELCDDAADAIEELVAAVPRWISVEERLPDKREWVLVRSKLVKMRTDFISRDGNWYTTPCVTHWMPLPDPPKEELNKNVE